MGSLSSRQFPLGDAPQEWGTVDKRNSDYGNDVVRSHLYGQPHTAELYPHDDDPELRRIVGTTGGRITTTRSWYYPGGRGQGKLFHDPKPVAKHRWPRGYDPQRQLEVGTMLDRFGGHAKPDAEAWVRDVVARSHTDVGPLKFTDHNGVERGRFIFTVHDDPDQSYHPGAAGFFDSGSQHISVSRVRSVNKEYLGRDPSGGSKWQPVDSSENVLLHEIGHAQSFAAGTHGRHEVNGEAPPPEWRGREEARADIHDFKTHVPRKKPRIKGAIEGRVERDYSPDHYYGLGQEPQKRQFSAGYREEHREQGVPLPSERSRARQEVLSAQQHRAAMREGIPAHVHEDQEMLFRRHGRSLADPERDYGQHEYYAGDDNPYAAETKPLGSIRIGRGVPPAGWRGQDVTPKRARQMRDNY